MGFGGCDDACAGTVVASVVVFELCCDGLPSVSGFGCYLVGVVSLSWSVRNCFDTAFGECRHGAAES